MWLFGHLFNMSYVIWSSGHLVIVSSGHLVILLSGLLVIWSFPILWNPVLFLWNTWIICAHSESCFGDLIEQSGYLVIFMKKIYISLIGLHHTALDHIQWNILIQNWHHWETWVEELIYVFLSHPGQNTIISAMLLTCTSHMITGRLKYKR